MEIGNGGVGGDRGAHLALGSGEISAMPRDESNVVGGDRVSGLAREAREDLAIAALGVVDAALLVRGERALDEDIDARAWFGEAAVAVLVALAAAARARVVAADLDGAHAGWKSLTLRASSRSSSREAPAP